MKIVAIMLLLAILLSLGQALLRLIRGASGPMWRMLAWRVGLSLGLYCLLLLAHWQAWL